MLLVYLDRYHLGDPLFLNGFARDLKAHTGPVLVVHGGGEEAERALEATGRVPERRRGALHVTDTAGAALPAWAGQAVERATRELNRRIVHTLNEAGVAAVRLLGADRGLVRRLPDGTLATGTIGWVRALMERGAVPVLALLTAEDGDNPGEGGPGGDALVGADPAAACVALARALDADGHPSTVVFLSTSRHPQLVVDGEAQASLRASDLGRVKALPEPETVARTARGGVRVRVTTTAALRGTGLPEGTEVVGG